MLDRAALLLDVLITSGCEVVSESTPEFGIAEFLAPLFPIEPRSRMFDEPFGILFPEILLGYICKR